MSSEAQQLHLFFLPLMAHGHMIPMIDMAILFAERGVKVSIITTSHHASFHQKTIDQIQKLGHQIQLKQLQVPYSELGLPQGSENLQPNSSPLMISNFFKAINMLKDPFEQLVRELLPDCIISDMFFPWTVDIAAKFNIPRLFFNGSSFFHLCVSDSLNRYKPHENVASDIETFVVPGLPHPIELTRSQLPDFMKTQNDSTGVMVQIAESIVRSYGVVMNSFYDLETVYTEHYKKISGKKVWQIGPVSLCNRNTERGKKGLIEESMCLRWLDGREPNSVIYLCFGTLCRFSYPQLVEIGLALEASNHPFIWVIIGNEDENLLQDGMMERLKEKGLIIIGWAPQILILNHSAVGCFVTHCGWNSILESVTAGVPMATWPVFADQFYNEKLVTRVLEFGVEVGSQVWFTEMEENKGFIEREEIQKAMSRVMGGGEEGEGMRKRVRELGEMARCAVEGGSSYVDMSNLIGELEKARSERGKREVMRVELQGCSD
ncbi:scopoletin glucosyltransferase-like [Tasmannia lanceolata]|uniref:scopoletin glucosyltransferase-like n=1 Tax=Tasmannia lanceolata TaxID=3420 RepID=UPI0040637BF8